MKVRDRAYLRKTVEHTGLSYREFAKRAGVSHAVLANLLREGGREGCSEKSAVGISSAAEVALGLLFLSPACVTDVQNDVETTTVQGLREGESER